MEPHQQNLLCRYLTTFDRMIYYCQCGLGYEPTKFEEAINLPINMVQDFSVVVDSVSLLEKYLRLSIKTVLSSYQEIAVKLIDRSTENYSLYLSSNLYDKKEHFPVILIGGWFKPDKEEHSYFLGSKPWITFNDENSIDSAIEKIDELIKINEAEWKKDFLETMGKGYNTEFNNSDGSIGVGYELKDCHCFPGQLAISMKHIYYGK